MKTLTDWWGHKILVNFGFLDPAAEIEALARAGPVLVARLDRVHYEGIEHPSHRSCLRSSGAADLQHEHGRRCVVGRGDQ